MTILPLTLCAVLCQDPQVPTPAATPRDTATAEAAAGTAHLDQVELVGGEVLEGRIVLQRTNYLEIELGPGAVVGFRTTNVVAIRPGAGAAVAAVAAPLPQHDEWFALHDGSGKAVGWLHSTATSATDGSVALQEEWEFESEQRQFQVTCLENVGADLQPRSCYFRERIREKQPGADPTDPLAVRERTGQERIVEAQVDGDVLVVARLTVDGRRERRLPWPAGATFPLLARQLAAAGSPGEPAVPADAAAQPEAATASSALAAATSVAAGAPGASAGEREFTVFDAATEEMQVCHVLAPRWRTVPIDGAPVRIAETIERGHVANTIWRDADAHVVRREIAGPALVAVPCLAAQARTAAGARTAVAAPFVAEPGRRFGLWRPNPVWQVLPPRPGSVALHSEMNHASIALSALPESGQELTLDAAAESALRWWSLLNPEFAIERRDWVRVRDRLSARIEFIGGIGADRQRTVLHVVPADTGFVVLRCSAPVARWNELQGDFDAAVAHLELVPGVVAAQAPPDQDHDGKTSGDRVVADVARAAESMPGADAAAAAAASAAAAAPLPRTVRVKLPSEQPFLRDGK